MPAEAEGVAQGEGDAGADGLVGRVVQVALRVRRVEVDGRRDNAVAQRKDRRNSFRGAGGPEHMSVHRFRGRNMAAVGEIAEGQLVGERLGDVVEFRAGAVRVDIDRVRRGVEARFFAGVGDAARLGAAVGPGCRGVISVAGAAVAHHFGVNLRAARLGVFVFFDDQDGRAVGHYEAAAVQVEGQGSVFGVRRPGQGLQVAEADQSERNGAVVRAARGDGVGVPVLDRPVGLADGMRGSGAGGDDVDAGALRFELDGHLSAGDVRNHRRDEHRGEPAAGRVVVHLVDFPVRDGETAHAGADIDAQAERVDVRPGSEARIAERLPGGGHRVNREGVLFADEGLVHTEVQGVESAHLPADLDGQGVRVELRDEVDAADPVHQVLPECVDIVPQARNRAHPGNDYSPSFHKFTQYAANVAKKSYL